MKLYGMGSPNVEKVLLMLAEIEQPYEFVWIDVFQGEQHGEAFGKVWLNRKVPALTDPEGPGGQPITLGESGAILIYLAEKAGRLLPAESRYEVLQWLMFQMAGVGPMFGQALHFQFLNDDDGYGRRRFTIELNRLLGVLEQRLAAAPFLAGEDYSIADIAVWPWVTRVDAIWTGVVTQPAVRRWMEKIAARRAARAIEPIMADLKKRGRASLKAATPEMKDRYYGRAPLA